MQLLFEPLTARLYSGVMRTFFCLMLLLSSAAACAQTREPVRLWPGDAPGALGKEEKDIPTLTPYLPSPAVASGSAPYT